MGEIPLHVANILLVNADNEYNKNEENQTKYCVGRPVFRGLWELGMLFKV